VDVRDVVYRLAARIPGWKRVLAAGRTHERILAHHFAHAFATGGAFLPETFHSHQEAEIALDQVVRIVEQQMADGLPDLLYNALVAGGNAAASNLQFTSRMTQRFVDNRALAKGGTGYAFNRSNPKAVEWARDHAAKLVGGITRTTRDKIREIIGDVLDGDSTWTQAMGDLEDIFTDKDRVRTIARTESMTAVNQGQRALWDQAVNDGYLDGDENQVWIVTPDDKLCDICDPLDGATAPLGKDFDEDGPPAHPNCRCTIGLLG